MPLDGHSYLVSQGWGGKGTGLRQGAISRPLAIPQKRTLAGLGKDRDEAFPFWDHLFVAAAKSIQVKLMSDGDDSDNEKTNDPSGSTTIIFKRTETGILSNRRPLTGTPITSGTSTPDIVETRQYNLFVTAKRDAAKRGLYSRFFRGPVLGPDIAFEQNAEVKSVDILATEHDVEPHKKRRKADESSAEKERKRSKKGREVIAGGEKGEGKRAEKRERDMKEEQVERKEKRSRGKEKAGDDDDQSAAKARRKYLKKEGNGVDQGREQDEQVPDSVARKRRKEERKRKKEKARRKSRLP